MKKINLEANTIERDVSWMYFNQRILQEAQKPTVPLLERLTFLGIYSNNLDEFYRVRIASLNRIIEYNDRNKQEKERAKKTLKYINVLNASYSQIFNSVNQQIFEELRKENIFVITEQELDESQQLFIRHFYRDKLRGYINPIWINQVKHLGEGADDIIHLAVKLQHFDKVKKVPDSDYVLIELPTSEFGRFVRLPDVDGKSYLMFLDDVVRACLPYIFQGMGYDTFAAYSFKFTKDAEMEIDSDLHSGIVQKISRGIKSRKKGDPLRVLYDKEMPKNLIRKILTRLSVDSLDTIMASGRYHNHKDLMEFPDCGRLDLKYPKWEPIIKSEFNNVSLIELIRLKDRYIHLPYHSFDSYIQLLRESAVRKDVKSIKTTLYRLAKDSQVIRALINAAKNGKKVTVVIELLARFDEESNINWSKKMEDAGVHVVFGVEGLKVHSKVTHIACSSGDIAVISTGNFHEGNAKAYTDVILMTANKPLVKEVATLFDFIEKPYKPVTFKHLLVSPNEMRKKFLKLIDTEIRNKKMGKPAYILCKINHVIDETIVSHLYKASNAGVDINLLVRGNCSLMTGVPGVSDRIHICGIIDRYLEHARIFIFCNGGEELYFIGSADWMARNFDKRIEVIAPVYDKGIQSELKRIVEYGLSDTVQGRIVDGLGVNRAWTLPDNAIGYRSQEKLYHYYKQIEVKS